MLVGDTLYVYYNCPSKFIPPSIFKWHDIYKYHKEFPGAQMNSYNKQNPRFLQAYFYFDAWYKKFSKEQER